MSRKAVSNIALTGVAIIVLLIGGCASFETVSTGHVAIGTRFGKVTGDKLVAGFHIVHPLNSWDHFNTLQRSMLFQGIEVPAADQQKATMDVSIQFSFDPAQVLQIRTDTGTERDALNVHFNPISRGTLRDAGRSTAKVEMFYDDAKIEEYRDEALQVLQTSLNAKGFLVTDVIVRDVTLPEVIRIAIEAKKKREQQVEEQRAELDRVELESQNAIVTADSNLERDKRRAEAIKVLARADAYKIDLLQKQLSKSPRYIEFVKAQRWDGVLPRFTGGGAIPFINLDEQK